MNYTKIRTKPKQFLALTSVTVEEFDELLPHFEKQLKWFLRRTANGGLRKNKLKLPDSLNSFDIFLFFILTYLKLNPLQEQHAASFDISQPSVSRLVRVGLKAINEALRKLGHQPCRDGEEFANFIAKIRSEQSGNQSDNDDDHFYVDASGAEVLRPLDDTAQEDNYSGKHHHHELKNTFISNQYARVLYLGRTFIGRTHDKKMVDEENIVFPDYSFIWKDLGYQGYLPDNVTCFEPHKKPRNGELTSDQKSENQIIASVRVVVEHAIGGVKRCRIVKEAIRLYNYWIRDMIIETCTALHNFRVNSRGGNQPHPMFRFSLV